jgi:uncharacterized membrane protein (DUF106 family)
MSLDILDIVITAAGAITGVIALAILKLRVDAERKKEYKNTVPFF